MQTNAGWNYAYQKMDNEPSCNKFLIERNKELPSPQKVGSKLAHKLLKRWWIYKRLHKVGRSESHSSFFFGVVVCVRCRCNKQTLEQTLVHYFRIVFFCENDAEWRMYDKFNTKGAAEHGTLS